MVEADPQRPLLPAQLVAVERERDALGLGDLERLDVLAQAQVGHQVRHVLAHRPRLVDAVRVLDLQQLHAVEIDDEVQAGDGVGVRARAGLAAVPDVGPADAPAAVRLRHEVRAVRPRVDQDAVHVGDAAGGERLDHARVAAQRLVALVELVDGHVRLAVGLVVPRQDTIRLEVDARLVDLAVVAVPADDLCLRAEIDAPFGGSRSSIDAKRQRSPTPWSRRSAPAASRISSALRGSRGCGVMTRSGRAGRPSSRAGRRAGRRRRGR